VRERLHRRGADGPAVLTLHAAPIAARSLGPPISDDFGQAHPAVAAAAARALAAEPRVVFGAACSECISFW
jgi:hypothetical protein